MNKVMNGYSIQTTPEDCTPIADWLGVTGTNGWDPGPNAWYTCYTPSSALPGEGASIVIFQQAATEAHNGWTNTDGDVTAAAIPVPADGTTLHFVGDVLDQQGRTFGLDFTADVLTPAVGDLAEGTVTATTVELTWTEIRSKWMRTYSPARRGPASRA